MDKETQHWIIDELGKGKTPDQVTFEACTRYRLSWNDADALVREVQNEHGDDVVRHQVPLLTVLAIVTLVGGAALMVNSGLNVLNLYETVAHSSRLDPSLRNFAPYATQSLYFSIAGFFSGLMMVLGSAIGMYDVWKAFIAWIEALIWP